MRFTLSTQLINDFITILILRDAAVTNITTGHFLLLASWPHCFHTLFNGAMCHCDYDIIIMLCKQF